MNRTEKVIKNTASNLIISIITNLAAFVTRTYFIKILGVSYLGLNGILTNVLSMLSLAELGVGTAINYSLYEPLSKNNEEKIKSLMNFYKRAYQIIGLIVLALGFVITLFSPYFIKDAGDISNVKLIFYIYIISNSLTYFISYKNTLLEADQKKYKIFYINSVFGFLIPISQLIVLLLTKNYIAYLMIQIVLQLLQRIILNRKISNLYPKIFKQTAKKLDKKELSKIKKNVSAMIFHKIGNYVVTGTSNIIISTFISLAAVGYYSNYTMIINIINTFILIIFHSFTSSVGNSIATEKPEYNFRLFNRINFLGFWLYGFSAICFYIMFNPFITLWLGNEYLLENITMTIIVINFFITGLRIPVVIVKDAAGLYSQDKYIPLIQSVILLFFSIFLIKFIGITGVVTGVLISNILPTIYRPYVIYKNVFKKNVLKYYAVLVKYILTVAIVALILNTLLNIIYIGSLFSFILRLVLCVIATNIMFAIIYYKEPEFKYLVQIMKGIKKWKAK